MKKNLLLVFVKNPELGKVKSRLAKKLGDIKALEVYQFLLKHTYNVTKDLACEKYVFYHEQICTRDIWDNDFKKFLQEGKDLGEKMNNAFLEGFKSNYSPIVIIGSDCGEITSDIIELSFAKLEEKDVVIGPARDGGYYLLGMNKSFPSLFSNKSWSSDQVFKETVSEIERLGISVDFLPVLSDVDEVEDLVTLPKSFLE